MAFELQFIADKITFKELNKKMCYGYSWPLENEGKSNLISSTNQLSVCCIVNLKSIYPFIVFDIDISSFLNKVSKNFFTPASFCCHMQRGPLMDRKKLQK